MADWLELDDVDVADRGDLAADLCPRRRSACAEAPGSAPDGQHDALRWSPTRAQAVSVTRRSPELCPRRDRDADPRRAGRCERRPGGPVVDVAARDVARGPPAVAGALSVQVPVTDLPLRTVLDDSVTDVTTGAGALSVSRSP